MAAKAVDHDPWTAISSTKTSIEYLKVNSEVSLEDLCKFCDLGKGLILSICRNDDNVVRRDIYDSNDGRITLFRYNEF